jgi:predicted DNA-binding transcriptional regulator AlpA
MEQKILKKENEIAEFFGWSRQTLANRRWNGDGPPYLKLSARCVRYDMEEVLKWAQAHEVRPSENA